MNLNNDKPSFLDRNTILAFALTMLVWFGWAKYQESTRPQVDPATQAAANPAANNAAGGAETKTSKAAETTAGATEPAAKTEVNTVQAEEVITRFGDERWSMDISSKGMGVRNIDIKDYKTRTNEPIILGNVKHHYPFATALADNWQPIDFQVQKTGENTFLGKGSVGAMQIEKIIRLNSDTYSIETEVRISGVPAGFPGVATTLSDTLVEGEAGSFFAPSYDHQDWFVYHDDTETRQIIVRTEGVELAQKNVTVASLSAHYFTMAVVDRSQVLPRFESKIAANSETATGRLVYQPVAQSPNMEIKYAGFAGPKSFHLLSATDEKLARVIDYGMFSFLAKPILSLLRWLYSVMGNWGWAIIALTILVRILVLPFNAYSFKSMKVMQKVQPEMNRIRERYKDKPPEQKMQMNQEIMELMKRHKANPLGGCLPMLIQLPVFFALYQVLGLSVELYRAPFILWIHDLSVKDPYYVLPVLMGVVMFVQQKITPNTMDPQQAKILMWMPVIFSFFMLSLPSGLTLYIFISTLFGIIQQMIFMRDRSATGTVKEAKA